MDVTLPEGLATNTEHKLEFPKEVSLEIIFFPLDDFNFRKMSELFHGEKISIQFSEFCMKTTKFC